MRKNTHKDYVLYLFVLLALIGIFWYLTGNRNTTSVTYSKMVQMFESKQVDSFSVQNDVVTMKLKKTVDGKNEATCSISSFDTFYRDLNSLIQKQRSSGVLSDYDYKKDTQPINWVSLLPSILSVIMVFLVLMMMVRQNNAGSGGGLSQFGKAKFTSANQMKKKVTFNDVAGAEEEKGELEEVVDFLRNPVKYTALGARIPKGIILVGPPGTGKTLLAKAVAGEAGVPFLSISGSDFVELYVGVGASRVRDLFEEAKKTAPSIVFIDEIDAVGRQRGAGLGGGHDEREQTLNQLLVEMDGFEGNSGVIVIAATNRADILDPALLRPGRFDRQVYVGLPDIKGRVEVLKVHSRKKPLAEDVDLKTLAKATSGFTGADLENLMNEGALLAARKNEPYITMEDLHQSVIKVIAGPEKKSHVVTPHARNLTAYHEAGHAIAMHALSTHDPVHQITIIPRGQAGGMTIALPQEDKPFRSRNELFEDIVALLGGRVAESLVLGDISTGASNDLERATATAHAMVAKYGMSDQLGAVVYDDQKGEVFIGRSMAQAKPYSEAVAAEIDHEVKALIDRAYQKCETLINTYRSQLEITAQYLLEHETMSAAEFEAVFTQAPA